MPDLPPRASSTPLLPPRLKTVERGYDADWERLRAYKLSISPACELRLRCQGNVATEVHHVLPISARPDLRLELSNLQSSCKPCHSELTWREQHAGGDAGGDAGGETR